MPQAQPNPGAVRDQIMHQLSLANTAFMLRDTKAWRAAMDEIAALLRLGRQ